MLLAILGRQTELSLAELENFFGEKCVSRLTPQVASLDCSEASLDQLGGTLKLAKIDQKISSSSPDQALQQLINYYTQQLPKNLGKLSLGISYYGNGISPQALRQAALKLKTKLQKQQISVRLLPIQQLIISTATAHHNQLGKNPKKIEIIIVQQRQNYFFARSIACQNISAYRDRDQKRPKRDARVGMLPPKLAQIMINLARPYPPATKHQQLKLLDPFCGTGVILQEALLLGLQVIGSDIEPKMVTYSQQNLQWLNPNFEPQLTVADATKAQWPAFHCVASEIYLGRPYQHPPSSAQLAQEQHQVSILIRGLLKNLAQQLPSNGQICLAVPAWLRSNGRYHDLELIKASELAKLGFAYKKFQTVDTEQLLYHRPGQIVARRLLVLQSSSNKS